MTTTEHEVAIAGGGPVGLMLAAELALAHVDVVVLERRRDQTLVGSRAGGLHARAIELLDQRGIAERFLDAGSTAQAAMFGTQVLDLGDFPTRHPYALGLWQNHIERIIAERVLELGVPVRYGTEVTGVTQDDEGVAVGLGDGTSLRARHLVGCDGGRSLVRRLAGIDFPGEEATSSWLIAEVEMAHEPEWGTRFDDAGVHGIGRLEEGRGTVRAVLTEPRLVTEGEPGMRDLGEALTAVYGTDYGIHDPTWISRFIDATRQAATYRAGRILLAGDAAHVHSPAGGQGLQNGWQDAVNLGWKLAQVVHGTSPQDLLDTYEAERRPVTARSLRYTMAQVALQRPGDSRLDALRATVSELGSMDEPRRHLGGLISGLDVRYDLGEGPELLGRRMPDLDLVTADGPRRVFTLLHDARPVLLDLGGPAALDAASWADRVRLVEATCDGDWELPVVGGVPAPEAVLIRPDGHVAWVRDGTDAGLADAMERWFGPRR